MEYDALLDYSRVSARPTFEVNLNRTAHPAKVFRRPGIERRQRLLQAARTLLSRRDMTQISLADVAGEARIPKGSAYFFYKDISDLYLHLVGEFGAEMVADVSRPVPGTPEGWQDIIRSLIRRGVRFYARHPAARQLATNPRTTPDLKLRDRQNDISLGQIFRSHVEVHFRLPEHPGLDAAFFRAVEIADLMFCLSVLEHGRVTPPMAAEAAIACIAYLQVYLGESLPRRFDAR